MAKTHIRMRYDGPALEGHAMDVAALAPALLALSDLCRLANQRFNGDRAAVKVLIHADAEHNCFEIGFDLVQTLWGQMQDLVGDHRVHSTKEILEWIGIVGGAATLPFGLMRYLAWRKGRAISKTEFTTAAGRDLVKLHIEGDNNTVTVYRQAYELANNGKAIQDAKRMVEPLKTEGYERLTFDSKADPPSLIDKPDAIEILRTREPEETEQDLHEAQRITAWVKVYSPVFDPKAHRWRFQFGDAHPYMDISQTDITEKALERGGSSVNDTYKVILEIQQVRTSEGSFKNKYRILEVLEFHTASFADQQDWVHESEAFPSDDS